MKFANLPHLALNMGTRSNTTDNGSNDGAASRDSNLCLDFPYINDGLCCTPTGNGKRAGFVARIPEHVYKAGYRHPHPQSNPLPLCTLLPSRVTGFNYVGDCCLGFGRLVTRGNLETLDPKITKNLGVLALLHSIISFFLFI